MELSASKLRGVASRVGVGLIIGCTLGCAARGRRESRTDLVFGPECKTVLRLRCERVDPPGECRIVDFKHIEGCEKVEVGKGK